MSWNDGTQYVIQEEKERGYILFFASELLGNERELRCQVVCTLTSILLSRLVKKSAMSA